VGLVVKKCSKNWKDERGNAMEFKVKIEGLLEKPRRSETGEPREWGRERERESCNI